METTPTLAIRVRDLTFGYTQKRVLDGVDLDVPEGRVTALVGANGAGRSTQLAILSGAEPYRARFELPWRRSPATVRVLGLDPLARRKVLDGVVALFARGRITRVASVDERRATNERGDLEEALVAVAARLELKVLQLPQRPAPSTAQVGLCPGSKCLAAHGCAPGGARAMTYSRLVVTDEAGRFEPLDVLRGEVSLAILQRGREWYDTRAFVPIEATAVGVVVDVVVEIDCEVSARLTGGSSARACVSSTP